MRIDSQKEFANKRLHAGSSSGNGKIIRPKFCLKRRIRETFQIHIRAACYIYLLNFLFLTLLLLLLIIISTFSFLHAENLQFFIIQAPAPKYRQMCAKTKIILYELGKMKISIKSTIEHHNTLHTYLYIYTQIHSYIHISIQYIYNTTNLHTYVYIIQRGLLL